MNGKNSLWFIKTLIISESEVVIVHPQEGLFLFLEEGMALMCFLYFYNVEAFIVKFALMSVF